jgi:hypothetical protein
MTNKKYKLNKDCFVYCVSKKLDKDVKFKKGYVLGECVNEGEEVMIFECGYYGSMYIDCENVEVLG